MSKKWAISLVLLGEAVIYLILLVGVPALESTINCPTCNVREFISTPLILYLLPGLIGLGIIVLIWKKGGDEKCIK